MSSTDYLVRAYRPGDEVAIQEVFAEVFGVDRSLAEWRWKFLSPPRGSRILLAFDTDGALVAQYAAVQVDVWMGDLSRAAQIVDVFARRRRGLGRRGGPFQATMERFLAECAPPVDRGGLSFIFGFPGERHQRAGTATGHYNEPLRVERLSLPLSCAPRTSGRSAFRSTWASEGFDAHATDRLWARSRERYRIAAVRDAAWFGWRYERHPAKRYRQIGLRRAGEPRAWGVLALGPPGSPARWVDLVWDGDRAEDLVSLATEVALHARSAGAETVELWLRGDPEARRVLLDLGYASELEPILRLSTITFAERPTVPEVLSDFYLTMGDSDHF